MGSTMRWRFWKGRAAEPLSGPQAMVPDGQVVYAIGDIHGRADLLARAARAIEKDCAAHPGLSAQTVFLGDYVDRGPDSAGVLARLTAADFPTPIVTLMGNHEFVMREVLQQPQIISRWKEFGALETLFSYGIDIQAVRAGGDPERVRDALLARIDPAQIGFLEGLRLTHSVGGYFFCHAGVRPGIPLEHQVIDDLIWIREPFLSSREMFGKVVVHGHTPSELPELKPNRINIDTGAYITGRLTCVRLSGLDVQFLIV